MTLRVVFRRLSPEEEKCQVWRRPRNCDNVCATSGHLVSNDSKRVCFGKLTLLTDRARGPDPARYAGLLKFNRRI